MVIENGRSTIQWHIHSPPPLTCYARCSMASIDGHEDGWSTEMAQANFHVLCIYFFPCFLDFASIRSEVWRHNFTSTSTSERGTTQKCFMWCDAKKNIDQRCPISLNKHIDKVNAATKEFFFPHKATTIATFKCQHVLYHAPFVPFDLMRFRLVFAVAFQLQKWWFC